MRFLFALLALMLFVGTGASIADDAIAEKNGKNRKQNERNVEKESRGGGEGSDDYGDPLRVVLFNGEHPNGKEIPRPEWAGLPQGEVVRGSPESVDIGERQGGVDKVLVNGQERAPGLNADDVSAEGWTQGYRWRDGTYINVRDYVGAGSLGANHETWSMYALNAWYTELWNRQGITIYYYEYADRNCNQLGGNDYSLKDQTYNAQNLIMCGTSDTGQRFLTGPQYWGWGGYKLNSSGTHVNYGYAMVTLAYPPTNPYGAWSHELGHGLGLWHTSCYQYSVMHYDNWGEHAAPGHFDSESLDKIDTYRAGCTFSLP